jgi:hypothetical protein
MDVSVRVSVVRIGRSRRRAVFVDFGNVAFAVDEFGQVVRIGEKVELPRGWEGAAIPSWSCICRGRESYEATRRPCKRTDRYRSKDSC